MHGRIYCLMLLGSNLAFADATIIPHDTLKPYGNSQNALTGVATPSLGAIQSEIWHSSIAVGSETPAHKHSHEEIVILLQGKIEAIVDGKPSSCEAPCTIILPAQKQHLLKNIGQVPTSHYLVMPAKSTISDATGQEMQLPWRK